MFGFANRQIAKNYLKCIKKYSTANRLIKKVVIISESNDIYTNLALEDWYYRNWNSEDKHMLILWSNNPCVVIGKFQNPWLEANVSELTQLTPEGVKLARRNSGGGTVYHDRGNLNLSFFTPRDHYNRKHNLEIITKAVMRKYGLNIAITKRDDLMLGDYKVSGTAAKLGRTVAYHHCTLLVDSDKDTLSRALTKPPYEITTNATRSTRSKITNLIEFNRNITVEGLMECIGKEYLLMQPVNAKGSILQPDTHNMDSTFRILTPTEEEFPGLMEIWDTLASWEWIFEKCPKFTAIKSYRSAKEQRNECYETKIALTVENGRVDRVEIQFCDDTNIQLSDYNGRKFSAELFDQAFKSVCEKQKHSIQTM